MPSTWQLPSVGESIPFSNFTVVVLPAPLAPRNPKISPGATLKLMPSTAVKLPKRLVSFSVRMTASWPDANCEHGRKLSFVVSILRCICSRVADRVFQEDRVSLKCSGCPLPGKVYLVFLGICLTGVRARVSCNNPRFRPGSSRFRHRGGPVRKDNRAVPVRSVSHRW